MYGSPHGVVSDGCLGWVMQIFYSERSLRPGRVVLESNEIAIASLQAAILGSSFAMPCSPWEI